VPRSRTDAAERTVQNRRLAARVSAELGRPVGVREAARHRQAQKGQAPPGAGYKIRDRVVEHDPSMARRRGQLLARVTRINVFAGGYVSFKLETDFEFAHTLTETSQLCDDRVLLVSFDELFPAIDRKISRREREAHRRRHVARHNPADTGVVVVDRRVPDLDATAETSPVGQLLARPLDLRSTASGDMLLELRTSPAVAHTLVDASTLSRGHQLLVTIDELPELPAPTN
jgi:hypothetical protein